jgi:hypothetical protein
MSMTKWVFGNQLGRRGSNIVVPANRRSCGRHSPGIKETRSMASALSPLTGYR